MHLFKNYAVKDWMAFAEVYGTPLRVGKCEPGATRTWVALMQAVRSLGSGNLLMSMGPHRPE